MAVAASTDSTEPPEESTITDATKVDEEARREASGPKRAETPAPAGSAYRLIVRIASGGMASVYVGTRKDAADPTLVAIKRTHPHLLEQSAFAKALEAEARVLARISHPNVVGIRELEQVDGELLLVMDYVDGVSFSNLQTQAQRANVRLPVPVIVRILLDTCAGLGEAHHLSNADGQSLGVVHRDVSPQNILVGVDGRSKIADFGIAKQMLSDATRTNTGILKGKISYMAPEYVEFGKQDFRGDVFALGLVMWEALTTKRPFDAPNEVAVLRKIADCPPPKPSSVAPWLDPALDEVVGVALSYSLDHRFPTARAFGDALEAVARENDLIATHDEVSGWVSRLDGASLDERRRVISSSLDRIDGVVSNSIEQMAEPVALDVAAPGLVPLARRRWVGGALAASLLSIGVARAVYLQRSSPSGAQELPLPIAAATSASEAPSREPAATSASEAPSREPSSQPSASGPSIAKESTAPASSRNGAVKGGQQRPSIPRRVPVMTASTPLHAPPNPYAKSGASR